MADTALPPGIELRHLRLVAALAEHGSLTAVARLMGLTQPALSHQLRDLEVRLRAPLFERTARRMVLTPLGEQLAHVARRVLTEVDVFERQVVDGEFSVARGKVRVATECFTAYHWLPPLLREFQDRWPKVELRLAPEHTEAPLAALRHGTLDLAIVYHRSSDRGVRFEPLFEDEMVLIVAPGHRLAEKDFVPLDALADEHLFHHRALTSGASVVRDILESGDVHPAKATQLPLTEAIIELVAADFGVALLARWAAAPAVRAGTVRAIRLGKKGYGRTWYVAVRSGDVTPAYQFDLIAMLRRQLNAGPSVRAGSELRLS